MASLDEVIKDNREAVTIFDGTQDGISYHKLSQQPRDTGKTMTDDEIALLESLNAQREALVFACNIAKQAKDKLSIKEAKQALVIFNNKKEGGKKRSSLMAKTRKCLKQLTAKEKFTLTTVSPLRKELEEALESSLKEKKDLPDKLTNNVQVRRKLGKCWFVPMDRLCRKHGVRREDYHKRKCGGRPLQQMKRASTDIFTDAKLLLREHKVDGVLDSEIDEVCDEVIALLTSLLGFFEAIMKFYATDADVNDAEQKKRKNDGIKSKERCTEGQHHSERAYHRCPFHTVYENM